MKTRRRKADEEQSMFEVARKYGESSAGTSRSSEHDDIWEIVAPRGKRARQRISLRKRSFAEMVKKTKAMNLKREKEKETVEEEDDEEEDIEFRLEERYARRYGRGLGEGFRTEPGKKCVDLRITGLDTWARRRDVRKAIEEAAGRTDDLYLSEIMQKDRKAIVWVQCTVEVANRLLAKRAICVYGTEVKISALERSGPLCFRCHRRGHTVSQCNYEDNSRKCFNCGEEGHRTSFCRNDPSCYICKVEGKPYDHRIQKSCRET